MTSNFTSIAVFCALDVGKSEHHGTALLADGRKTFDKPLPNNEPQLRDLFARLQRKGRVLVVVDQPASIGALPVAVARASGCEVAYLPGLSMRRLADLHPGSGKTDARDAFVIADAARTMPHLLRSITPDESVRAELAMVLGHDDDLAGDATRISNRLRGLLTSIHPALERVLGPRLRHPAVLALLQAFGSPAALAQAGGEEITRTLLEAAPRMRTAQKMTEQVMAALAEQTVTVPGTAAAGDIIPGLAEALAVILHRREVLEDRIASLLEAHPLAKVLTSMPGVAVRTGARILAAVGDGSAFPTAAHLASYAGLAPTTYRSGTSIQGEGPPRGGNKPLKRALFLASFASLSSPDSRAYYDRKRGEGKRHNAALICLTRRRIDVLHAMLKHRAAYQPTHEQAA
ncbi:Transposase IS116/IS110/IS902 family protein [Streptomyces sp. 3213]|uniref:IS110 family transposase n=1 Tax=Streptomyces sp. 3213.3 TaxID=1855348 RepID=UPI0008954AFD|nr:IS110 family transposase [Streptomyces sp. 3213.3]SED90252.1 Transposase IS116/IS110/IS902 family protein [Streptomyces sp. 3213] [Streptomyces sp. 3213.3]